LHGDRQGAQRAIALARAQLSALGYPHLLSLTEIPEGLLDLAAGDRESAQRRALALLAVSSDDVKIALRVLSSRLDQAAAETRAFRLAKDGSWLRPPGQETISLARWPLLCRILSALLSQRLSRPGEPLPMRSLLEVGWPGDRSKRASALN